MPATVVTAGDPVLRLPAAPIPKEALGTPALRRLVDEMIEAMRAAPGVGLAAPQIGVAVQLIVLEDSPALMAYLTDVERDERARVEVPLTAIVNPVLRRIGEAEDTFFEGCLSVPGYTALVTRAHEVEVQGFTPDGAPISWRASGWPARILQHECDHVAGVLYVDRMLPRSFATVEQARERHAGRTIAEIRAALLAQQP